MRGVKVKVKKTCLWRVAVVVITILYLLSIIASLRFFGKAIYAETHPGVSVSNMNIKQHQKLAFPSLQLCSLPREHMHALKCNLEDKCPPGQSHIGELAEPGSKCELKVDFRSADGNVMCYRVDPNFNASSPSRFSSILISVGIGESGNKVVKETIDAFKGVDGILLHVFDKHENPPPFAGSVVLPVGRVSEVALHKQVLRFPISGRKPQAHYNPSTTFATWEGHQTGHLYDIDNGFDLSQAVATRIYFATLSTSVEVEVNEYTFENAIGDASGISGFLVGFAFWGGPAFATAVWDGCGGREITLF